MMSKMVRFFFESGPKKRHSKKNFFSFFLFRVCIETLNRELEKRKKDETLINTLSLTGTRKEEEEDKEDKEDKEEEERT